MTATTERHCRTCKCFAPKPKRRSSGGIKRTSADAKWSREIRERSRYRCQFMYEFPDPRPKWAGDWTGYACAKEFESNSQGLHAAHCFTRAIKATRLDPDNGLAMCWPHHRAIDSDKALKYAIFRWWLGDERFDELEARAKAKRDRPVRQPKERKR